MKCNFLYSLVIVCFFVFYSCGSSEAETDLLPEKDVKIKKFNGNYGKTFNDLHDVQIVAAMKNGITPMAVKSDTANLKDQLVYIPQNLPTYTTDKLTHSIPYLVPKASDLLIKISANFRDSLISKGIVSHRLILTSLTRTNEDVKSLTKRNVNASQQSTHCFGTTFDISWKRFEKQNPFEKDVPTDKLKFVLGQVLYELQQREMCYIKHERKQACFHITVR